MWTRPAKARALEYDRPPGLDGYRQLVRTFIFIAGAPGSGKSSVAAAVQRKLGTPLFEFGWIPEFRNTGTRTISYEEDESLAFENLTLVLRNYARHGFRNIIVTDLENKRIEHLAACSGASIS